MMAVRGKVFVSHSQVVLCQPQLAEPFSDWAQVHVDQGFVWRHDAVSFGTLDDGGELAFEAIIADTWIPHPASTRAIRVPFTIASSGQFEIATVLSPQSFGHTTRSFSPHIFASQLVLTQPLATPSLLRTSRQRRTDCRLRHSAALRPPSRSTSSR